MCAGIASGYYISNALDYALGQKIIGFSVLGGVVVYMPLFLYHRWKGKALKDYTLTPENLNKMKSQMEGKSGKKHPKKKEWYASVYV